MIAQDIRRELSRRFYVTSRTARAAAVRLAYAGIARALQQVQAETAAPEALLSLRTRIE